MNMEVRQTAHFVAWLQNLRDLRARARIQMRLDRLAAGNPGDIKSVGSSVQELRIDYGPGYRVYLTYQGTQLVVLLAGGDKSSQANDIEMAKNLARNWGKPHVH